MSLRIISLWQPYASLVVWGLKRFETRHWSTTYRGPLGIHAEKRKPDTLQGEDVDLICEEAFGVNWRSTLPRGALLGCTDLLGCEPTEAIRELLSDRELSVGNFEQGRFAWHLSSRPTALVEPIQMRGQQGFWSVDQSVLPEVLRRGA